MNHQREDPLKTILSTHQRCCDLQANAVFFPLCGRGGFSRDGKTKHPLMVARQRMGAWSQGFPLASAELAGGGDGPVSD